MSTPRLRVTTTTLSASDAQRLASFYERLLGWERGADEDGWVTLRSPDGGHSLGFHHDEHHRRPAWPSTADAPPMMAHLEIAVDDLAAAADHALACGAELAATQPQDDVRVMFDPDGHPFCLWLWADMP